MLSEEEKQAIKECERLSKQDYYGDLYFLEKYSIQILLNLLEKQQKENEELRKGQKSLMQNRKIWKDKYYKLREKNRKIIDKMADNIELQQYANIDTTDIDLICKRMHCNKKCRLISIDCIKKYFKRIIRR